MLQHHVFLAPQKVSFSVVNLKVVLLENKFKTSKTLSNTEPIVKILFTFIVFKQNGSLNNLYKIPSVLEIVKINLFCNDKSLSYWTTF